MLLLTCKAVILINLSKLPWNSTDRINLKKAVPRCSELFKNSPCLKKFIKVDYNTYRVVCGDYK